MEQRSSILVAGAINTDLVASVERAPEAGETVTGRAFAIHGGGKGANQAVAAARSGGDVTLVGAVGDDDFGRSRLADLRRDGIAVNTVLVNDEVASGVALITVETHGENRIAYVPGATLTVPVAHAVEAFDAAAPTHILATNELPNGALEAMFRRGREAAATIVFNATPEPETAQNLIPLVSILIVNELEAMALSDQPGGNPAELVERLAVELGCSVVLTAGPDGAYGRHEGVSIHVPGEQVQVVDTTGAGDTFCGAMVAELALGSSFEVAVGYGVRAASLSVQRAGAQSSIPMRSEVTGE